MSPRSKNDKGRFVKAPPKPTGYEYTQTFVSPDAVDHDRNSKAAAGWAPDPAWMIHHESRGKILVVYRRKKA